jgi:hypothetical protein
LRGEGSRPHLAILDASSAASCMRCPPLQISCLISKFSSPDRRHTRAHKRAARAQLSCPSHATLLPLALHSLAPALCSSALRKFDLLGHKPRIQSRFLAVSLRSKAAHFVPSLPPPSLIYPPRAIPIAFFLCNLAVEISIEGVGVGGIVGAGHRVEGPHAACAERFRVVLYLAYLPFRHAHSNSPSSTAMLSIYSNALLLQQCFQSTAKLSTYSNALLLATPARRAPEMRRAGLACSTQTLARRTQAILCTRRHLAGKRCKKKRSLP